MRKDLEACSIVVQSSHAAIEIARSHVPLDLEHPHLVVISIDNEQKLQKCLDRIESEGIICKPFYESDLGDQLTAFATEPIPDNQKAIFRRYQLLKASDFIKGGIHGLV